jgi:hypothetical protein
LEHTRPRGIPRLARPHSTAVNTTMNRFFRFAVPLALAACGGEPEPSEATHDVTATGAPNNGMRPTDGRAPVDDALGVEGGTLRRPFVAEPPEGRALVPSSVAAEPRSAASAAPPAGCAPAREVALSEIALYQTVKISLAKAGVPVANRAADVVADKAALLRVFVQPTYTEPHDLVARVVVQTPGASPHVVEKRAQISSASFEEQPLTTFNFAVPADQITPNAEYAVELFDCTDLTGTAPGVRYPTSGLQRLAPRVTGSLKIKIVPVAYTADGSKRLPDTSSQQLERYRNLLLSMYPVTSIELTQREAVSTAENLAVEGGWPSLLDAMRALRSSDNAPSDVYYYGLVVPGADLGSYCGEACVTGIAFVAPEGGDDQRAGFGIGYGDETSAYTMAHEIGHLHGRHHAPCGVEGDTAFPYSGAFIGDWGYDAAQGELLAPATYRDVMSYCWPQWISDYSYQAILERVEAVNAPKSLRRALSGGARYRTAITDATGVRWGVLEWTRDPSGQEESADVIDVNGARVTTVRVFRTDMDHASASSYFVPEPSRGWAAIQLRGRAPLAYSAPAAAPLQPLQR